MMHSVSDAWTLTAVSCSLCCFARRELDATDCFALCRYSNHSYYDKTTPIRVLTLLTSMAIPNYPLATSTDMSHWSSDCCSSAFLCREMGNDRSCAQRLAFREEAATEKSYYSVLWTFRSRSVFFGSFGSVHDLLHLVPAVHLVHGVRSLVELLF